MKYIFLLLFIVTTSCSIFKGHENIEYLPFEDKSKNVTIWIDMYNPISYAITFNENDTVKIKFFTHNYRTGRLVDENYYAQKSEWEMSNIAKIKEIDKCSSYPMYVCLGLDGSEIWLENSQSEETILRKFWSPESQMDTDIGLFLSNIKTDLKDLYKIDSLKNNFQNNLRNGQYWNFGSGMLKVKS